MGFSRKSIRKKLEAAARYWAGDREVTGIVVDENIICAMIADGAPQEVIDAAQSNLKPTDDDFEVWQENWNSLLFFLAVSTQWNVAAGMSGLFYVGLNHVALEANMNMRNIKKQNRLQLCNDMQLMERAALEILNKKD